MNADHASSANEYTVDWANTGYRAPAGWNPRCAFLPFLTTFQSSEASPPTFSIGADPFQLDRVIPETCQQCNIEVEFYDLSTEFLDGQGYHTKDGNPELTLIIHTWDTDHRNKDCHLNKFLLDARFERLLGGIHAQGWQPIPFRGSNNLASNIFKGLLASRIIPQDRIFKEKTTIFLCSNGYEGPRVPQPVSKFYNHSSAKLWLDNCKTCHKDGCNQDSPSIEGLLLLDCNTGTVVKAKESDAWLALSYVWGPESTDSPPGMPQTIADAITVTKNLGYQYLWVDLFCIDQKDDTHKQSQIKQMDKIYRGADLTIVAAAGDSKHYGLSGVKSERTPSHRVFKINERLVLWSGEDPLDDVRDRSTWWTRAWTFQELHLSKRLLVFTKSEISFYCRNASWRESLGGLEHITTQQQMSWPTLSSTGSLFWRPDDDHVGGNDEQQKSLAQFRKFANQYTQRSLRYETDALDAFSGIMLLFQGDNSAPNLYNISGLPYIPSPSDEKSQIGYIFASLCWYHSRGMRGYRDAGKHKPAVERRAKFPSWTWAGWSGEIDWAYDRPHEMDEASFAMQGLMFGSQDEMFSPPTGNFLAEKLRTVEQISFTAPVVPHTYFASRFQFTNRWVALIPRKYTPTIDVSKTLGNPKDFLIQLEMGNWSCFLLSEYISSTKVFMLVVEWREGHIAERVGHICMKSRFFELDSKTLEHRAVTLV